MTANSNNICSIFINRKRCPTKTTSGPTNASLASSEASASTSAKTQRITGVARERTLFLGDSPNHCDSINIPEQRLSSRTLNFQSKWLSEYPWLHFSEEVHEVLCFYCTKATQRRLLSLLTKADPAFATDGFRNWKKANKRCSNHQRSVSHGFAINQLTQVPADEGISKAQTRQKQQARTCSSHIISSARFLTAQDLAFRGHEQKDGNFYRLLELRCEDCPELSAWQLRKTNFTNWDTQNDILSLLGRSIVKQICLAIGSSQYAIIVDGTQDISGQEQASICLRHVDDNLIVKESFVRLYNLPSGTGAAIAAIIKDALIRLGLPINNLRGQTCDGAANMSGSYNGAQALIKAEQSLALYVHCAAHCTNLVMQATANECQFVCDCVQWIHELGALSSRSIKMRNAFSDLARDANAPSSKLRPLCPTRWTVRTPAIKQVLLLYDSVCTALAEMGLSSDQNVGSRARVLVDRFENGTTFLGLRIALIMMEPLETLNRALQS